MSTVLRTPDWILRKCLAVLHAKLNFIGSINRNYDSQFQQGGAKIGSTLRIRLPEQYTVTTGSAFVAQDITQQDLSLTVATQKHVGLKLTSADLTMKDEDFMERHVVPGMSVLASNMEADALNMAYDVYNMVGTPGSPLATLQVFGNARAKLNQFLAPNDGRRTCLIDSGSSASMAEAQKTFFLPTPEIEKSYLEGTMGRAQGFTFAENDLLPVLATGTRSTSDTCLLSATSVNGDTSIVVTGLTGSATIAKAEILTMKGIYAVHPETKTPYSFLQQFTVTELATMSSGNGTIKISPAIYVSGPLQNVSATPTVTTTQVYFDATDGGSGSASTSYGQCLAFHKDAFAFVSADLPLYEGQTFMARKVIDGLAMRIWKWADGTSDAENTRIDVLYGYKTIRPQLACRITR